MVSISIYGLGKPKGTWPDSPFTVLGGVDKSGWGVLAERRHCEIKINWQEMFAIQIPIPAGRAEGTGRAEPVEVRGVLLRAVVSFHWKGCPSPFLTCSRKFCVRWL